MAAEAQTENQPVRALKLTDATALVIGGVIGTGVFLKAAVMTQQVGTPTLVLTAWVAAGLLSLAGALTYAELGAMMPNAGGEYVYLRESYGAAPAFLYGWTQIAVAQTAGIAALATACAAFISTLVPLTSVWAAHSFRLLGRTIDWQFGLQQVVAIGLILIFSAINCGSILLGGRVQSVLTAAKVLGIAVIVGGVFFLSPTTSWANLRSAPGAPQWSGMTAFGAAMLAALWAYNGWNFMPMAAGEVKEPGRNIPRALIGGVLLVILIYCVANLSYFYALPVEQVATGYSTAYRDGLPVATKAAQTFLGEAGARFVSVIFILSTIGALNAGILGTARIPFAMARDGFFFSPLGDLSKRTRVPVRSIILQAVWSSVLALSGTFDQLTDMAIFALWICYGLTASSVFVLRRRLPDAARPYRTLGYPVVPLLFVIVAVWLVINTLGTNPVESVTGLGLIALGLPLYFYFRRKQPSAPRLERAASDL
jgi:APA family basic amino acid/polyamine antiporter